jgi:hypothetical protein
VERFDGERHGGFLGVFQRRGDAVEYLRSRELDVLVRGFSRERAGQRSYDEHETGTPERRCFIDGTAIVFERRGETGGVRGREETTAAIPGELQIRLSNLCGDLLEAHGLHLITPGADQTNVAASTGLDDFV